MNELVQKLLEGNRRAVARLLTYVENEREGVGESLAALFPHTGRAWVIGITGAPGTGKSSLVNTLAKAYRALDKTVAIIAVDPTSPFTGGAILGDRVRMRDLFEDTGVFIRSMATRGSLGGLSRATRDSIRVFDAAGFDIILVETVGAGQSEVDIVRTAQTTIVVEAPGLGDEVQAIKAGILEIADILVVNKADRAGSENTVRGLRSMLEMGHPSSRTQLVAHHGRRVEVQSHHSPTNEKMWIPVIVKTVATDSDAAKNGISTLVETIAAHREYLSTTELSAQLEHQRIELELHSRLQEALMQRLLETVNATFIGDIIRRIQARDIDPQQAVREILEEQNSREK